MRKNKKSMVSVLVVSVMVMTGNVAAVSNVSDFKDIPTDWSNKAIVFAIESGLVDGHNGYIHSQNALTRAEVASMASRLLGGKTEASLSGYDDIDANASYVGDLAKAVNMGFIGGADGKMRPNDLVTREEAFVIIARILVPDMEKDYTLEQFNDKDGVSFWAKKETGFLVSKKLIGGSNGNINHKSNITRAELSQILMNLSGTIYKENGVYTQNIEGNVLVLSENVSFKNITINGDLIVADGVDAGKINLEGVKVNGSVIMRSNNSLLTADKNSNIDSVVLYGDGSVASGEGTVHEVRVSGQNTNMTLNLIKKDETVVNKVPATTQTKVDATSSSTKNTSSSGGSSSGGGGGSSSGGSSSGGSSSGGGGGSTSGGTQNTEYTIAVKESFLNSPTSTAKVHLNGSLVIGYTLYVDGKEVAIDADKNGSVTAPKGIFTGAKEYEAVLANGQRVKIKG